MDTNQTIAIGMVTLVAIGLFGSFIAWIARRITALAIINKDAINNHIETIVTDLKSTSEANRTLIHEKLDGISDDVKRINGSVVEVTERAHQNSERIAKLEGWQQNQPGP